MKKRCRHGGSWLIAGGFLEWCWKCGALREMAHQFNENSGVVRPATRWTRPAGEEGRNPWPMKELKRDGE